MGSKWRVHPSKFRIIPIPKKHPRQEPQFSISVTGFDGERAVTLSGYGHGYDFGYDFATVLVHAQNTLPRRTGSPQFVPHSPVDPHTPATATASTAPLFAFSTITDLRQRAVETMRAKPLRFNSAFFRSERTLFRIR